MPFDAQPSGQHKADSSRPSDAIRVRHAKALLTSRISDVGSLHCTFEVAAVVNSAPTRGEPTAASQTFSLTVKTLTHSGRKDSFRFNLARSQCPPACQPEIAYPPASVWLPALSRPIHDDGPGVFAGWKQLDRISGRLSRPALRCRKGLEHPVYRRQEEP